MCAIVCRCCGSNRCYARVSTDKKPHHTHIHKPKRTEKPASTPRYALINRRFGPGRGAMRWFVLAWHISPQYTRTHRISSSSWCCSCIVYYIQNNNHLLCYRSSEPRAARSSCVCCIYHIIPYTHTHTHHADVRGQLSDVGHVREPFVMFVLYYSRCVSDRPLSTTSSSSSSRDAHLLYVWCGDGGEL